MFDTDGFLCGCDFDALNNNLSKSHSEWFCLVNALNKDAMRIRRELQPLVTDNKQILAVMLFYRALQSFQGAILLATRGMSADALTLVRNCAESAIAMGGVAHDTDFVNTMIAGYNKHRTTLTNVFLNDDGLANELSEEQKEQGKTLLQELKGESLQGVNWDTLATKVNMSDLYNTVYRATSGDAAHATLLALTCHARIGTRGVLEQLIFQPDFRDCIQAFSMAVCSLLNSMEQLNLVITIDFATQDYLKNGVN